MSRDFCASWRKICKQISCKAVSRALCGVALYYYTFLNEKSKHNYEIDFLISKRNKICPIEVKSSGYNTHKSLDVFVEKYSDRILDKYLVYTKDLKKDADVLMMPVYMVPFIK